MSATPARGRWPRPGLSVTIGMMLIVTGLGVCPPGYWLATLGHAEIVSGFMRAVAWGLSACLLAAGALLVAFRPRFQTANVVLAIVSCLISLAAAEGILALSGFDSPYHLVFRVPPLVPWFSTDAERGVRMVPGKYFKRGWPINQEGFGDPDEFIALPPKHNTPRVLLLGDSFTFGINASNYDKSFAGIIKKRLKEESGVVVWNAAIPGTGQPQELDSLRRYFPLLEPDIVVLGFYMNDFNDDLYPIDALAYFSGGTAVLRYELNASGSPRRLTLEQAYRRAMMAPERPLQYIATSRVGFLALTALTRIRDACVKTGSVPGPLQKTVTAEPDTREPVGGYTQARGYLRQMDEYVRAHNARFAVLAIPVEGDLAAPGSEYKALTSLCKELGIECVEVRSNLVKSDYYGPPDLHWNDSGHLKVAEALLPRLRALLNLPGHN